MPKNRNFLVSASLEEIALGLKNWKYTLEQINTLLKMKLISKNFAKYLKNFKFSGNVSSLPDGSIFFPGEPIMRITAPIIEGNLFTCFFITSVCSNTIFASKFVRSVLAAKHINVIGPGPNRAHSFESSMKAQRASTIVGSKDTATPVVRKLLNIPGVGGATIAFHAFIKSYDSELEAMQTAAKHAKVTLSLMVDTYNYKQGIKNAIKTIKKYQKKKTFKIVIDSGDLYKNTVMVRKELDKAGLSDVKITVVSNVDEYKIQKMVQKKIPADTFIVNTEALTSSDAPSMEVVMKVSEIIKNGKVYNKMKLSPQKMSLPGRKQVYRKIQNGKFVKDTIGLVNEKKLGKSLLIPIFNKGKQVCQLPNIFEIKKYFQRELAKLSEKYQAIDKIHTYPVKISSKLQELIKKTKSEIR